MINLRSRTYATLAARHVSRCAVAAERSGSYDTAEFESAIVNEASDIHELADAHGIGLVDATSRLENAAMQVADAVDGPIGGQGDIAALRCLLRAIDIAQAAALRLTDQIDRSPHEPLGLPLGDVLSALTSQPKYAHRQLRTAARRLTKLPNLAAAFRTGEISYATIRACLQELAQLPVDQQEQLDASMAWTATGRTADDLLADVRTQVIEAVPAKANRQHLNQIEQRFLALTPQLDGTLTLYGQLDPEAAAAFTFALDTAASDVSLHKHDHSKHAHHPRHAPDGHRSRARRNADALTSLARSFIIRGSTHAGNKQPKPFCVMTVDLETVLDDGHPRAGLLRNHLHQHPVALTPEAARRLASDASWKTVLTHNGHILGTSDPVRRISTALRDVVHTRDQHCRFPGCVTPAHKCDLHHVTPIEQGGPTHPDNLIALCRRHHTAVTQHKWRLTMEPDGTATVTRGNHKVVTRPPLHPARRAQPPPDSPGPTSGAQRSRNGFAGHAQQLGLIRHAPDGSPQVNRDFAARSTAGLPF